MEHYGVLTVIIIHFYKRWLGITELSGSALWRSRSETRLLVTAALIFAHMFCVAILCLMGRFI
jgi:hypothetical protein